MTAQRWWVRLAARWLARVDGVSSQIRLAMLGLTGVSTATITLRQYGYGQFAWPLIFALIGGTVVYTYLFTEGGVWNQMARDRRDMSANYSTPVMRIDDEIEARAFVAGLKSRPLSDAERTAIKNETDSAWAEFRDGLEFDEVVDA